MERKGPSGFSLFLIIAVIVFAVDCRSSVQRPVDPASHFDAVGGPSVRELGIYSGDERVGDLLFTVRTGTWDGVLEAMGLTEIVHLRISFRGEKFSLKSDQTVWVDSKLNMLGSEGAMDFGAGRWETRMAVLYLWARKVS